MSKQITALFTQLRTAQNFEMLSYYRGQVHGFMIGSQLTGMVWNRLYWLMLNADEMRRKELFAKSSTTSFMLDQAA